MDDDDRSIGGFLGNLGSNVTDAIVGLGPSIYSTGRAIGTDVKDNPWALTGISGLYLAAAKPGSQTRKKVIDPVARSYQHTYGPLVRGDIKEFGRRFYNDPLGPLLDATAVLSGGVTAAAKVGLAPAALKRGSLALALPDGTKVPKPLPRQTLRAEMRVGADALLKRYVPADARYFGEYKRAAREAKRTPHRTARSRELLQEPFLRSLSRVRNKDERLAAFWLTQVPNTQDLGRLAAQLEQSGGDAARATAAMIRDPKFLEKYQSPTPRMFRVIEDAAGIAEAQRAILGISEDVARQRAYMPMLVARGATYKPIDRLDFEGAGGGKDVGLVPPDAPKVERTRPRRPDEARSRLQQLEDDLRENLRSAVDAAFPPAVRQKEQALRNARPKGKRAQAAIDTRLGLEGIGRTTGSVLDDAYARIEEQAVLMASKPDADPVVKKVAAMIAERDAIRRELSDLDVVFGDKVPDLGGVTELVPGPGFSSIDEMIAGIDADLAAAGRPKPVYMPHVSEQPKGFATAGTGGRGVQRPPAALKQTMGILLGRGQLIADPSVLRGSFVKAVKFRLYSDIHDLHIEHARTLPKGDPLPKGWGFVRRKHSDKFPHTVKTEAQFKDWADQHLDRDADIRQSVDFTSRSVADAVADEDGYLIVPESFSRELTGEFVRANSFLTFMNRYPIRVWRHLTLKLRPAWLVNNMIGNSLLYLMATGSVQDITALGQSFKRLAPKREHDAFDRLLETHFPEQKHGTFIGSQLPVLNMGTKGQRFEQLTSVAGAGIAQADRVFEQALRSAKLMAALRRSPELRSFAGKMRRQTDEFWRLADQELSANPELIARVGGEVNDALGDFLSLSAGERNIVRAVFPFYAWYRVITLLTLKMPVTHPYKTAVLARLGQVGVATTLEELGLSEDEAINLAKGFVPFGPELDGRVRGVSTTGMNPYATVAQLEDFVAALAVGQPGEARDVLPGLNPFFAVPLDVLYGSKGTTQYQNRYGLLGTSVEKFARTAVPQVRLGDALLGTQYQGTPSNPTLYDKDRADELLRYAGVPYARVSPDRLRELADR